MGEWLTDFYASAKLLEKKVRPLRSHYTALGNEMSLACGWLPRTWGKYIVTGEHYLKFGTEATLGGHNNPRAYLYWFKLDYAKYSFDLQPSPRVFERKLYDFSQGTPLITGIRYDGTNSTTMTPGTVQIKAVNGNRTQDVGAFYANAEKAVTITADDDVKKHGFKLAGVYFAKSNVEANSLWDGSDYTNKRGDYYYVSADSEGKSISRWARSL